ncbi:MAG: GNAT family N-acetyltransferase [Gammaproteobacteria bacterium]
MYQLLLDDAEVGYIEYDPVRELSILIKHTEVLPEHEGKGYGSQLVRRVLDDIHSQTKTVIPICPYAMNYVRRHRNTSTSCEPTCAPRYSPNKSDDSVITSSRAVVARQKPRRRAHSRARGPHSAA